MDWKVDHVFSKPRTLGYFFFKSWGLRLSLSLLMFNCLKPCPNSKLVCLKLNYIWSLFTWSFNGFGSSSQCQGFVCSLWLWYILIILTYFICPTKATFNDLGHTIKVNTMPIYGNHLDPVSRYQWNNCGLESIIVIWSYYPGLHIALKYNLPML